MKFLGGVTEIFERTCGQCNPSEPERSTSDKELNSVFQLMPLVGSDPTAVRATQKGIQLFHDGKIDEAPFKKDSKRTSHHSEKWNCSFGSWLK